MRNAVFSNTYDSAVAAMFEREAASSAVWDVKKEETVLS